MRALFFVHSEPSICGCDVAWRGVWELDYVAGSRAAQTALAAVLGHHLAVADHVGAPDLEDPAFTERDLGRGNQIIPTGQDRRAIGFFVALCGSGAFEQRLAAIPRQVHPS